MIRLLRRTRHLIVRLTGLLLKVLWVQASVLGGIVAGGFSGNLLFNSGLIDDETGMLFIFGLINSAIGAAIAAILVFQRRVEIFAGLLWGALAGASVTFILSVVLVIPSAFLSTFPISDTVWMVFAYGFLFAWFGTIGGAVAGAGIGVINLIERRRDRTP